MHGAAVFNPVVWLLTQIGVLLIRLMGWIIHAVRRLIDRIRDQHSRQLTDNGVAVVTQADQRASKTDVTNIVTGYDELAREVVTIPHDPTIVDGILQWDSLRPSTQRVWLRAAARGI